jgi:hypothetical protein
MIDGPGSLRWACEKGGARIVVFNVAGIIHIKTRYYGRAPYITIEGQQPRAMVFVLPANHFG